MEFLLDTLLVANLVAAQLRLAANEATSLLSPGGMLIAVTGGRIDPV